MLSKAKNNSIEDFYRNLDRQNAYKVEEGFRNKAEFNDYKNNFKAYKRDLENNFQNEKGNYNFKDNKYHNIPVRDTDNPFL